MTDCDLQEGLMVPTLAEVHRIKIKMAHPRNSPSHTTFILFLLPALAVTLLSPPRCEARPLALERQQLNFTFPDITSTDPDELQCVLVRIRSAVTLQCREMYFAVGPADQQDLRSRTALPPHLRPLNWTGSPKMAWNMEFGATEEQATLIILPDGRLSLTRRGQRLWEAMAGGCRFFPSSATWIVA